MKSRTILFGAALAAIAGGAAVADRGDSLQESTLGEVHFRFDSSQLPDNAQTLLASTIEYAKSHPDSRIVLDAHCDPIGTQAYNTGLAIRRAESVREQLRSQGVPDEQLVIAVYGERGALRATYAEDRRVSLWATSQPVAKVIDKTFGADGVALRWERPMTVAEIQSKPDAVARK
jgi:outer membrane protein OmpA-like peptidoglycan-associated protein